MTEASLFVIVVAVDSSSTKTSLNRDDSSLSSSATAWKTTSRKKKLTVIEYEATLNDNLHGWQKKPYVILNFVGKLTGVIT
jgi:hypothetical protein